MDEAIFPTVPSSNWNLLKRSLILYSMSFSHVVLLSLILGLIAFTPRFLSDLVGIDLFTSLTPFSVRRLWLIFIDFVAIFFFIGIIWSMYCVASNRFEPIVEDIWVAIRKFIAVVVATFIQGLIVCSVAFLVYGIQVLLHEHNLLFNGKVSGLILTIIVFSGQFFLMLYVSTLFIFVLPLIATENNHVFHALGRSASLVWKNWWRTFSLQLTPWVIYVFFLFMIRNLLTINVHVYFITSNSSVLWITVINLVAFVLFAPWVASIMLLQLKDLELRKNLG